MLCINFIFNHLHFIIKTRAQINTVILNRKQYRSNSQTAFFGKKVPASSYRTLQGNLAGCQNPTSINSITDILRYIHRHTTSSLDIRIHWSKEILEIILVSFHFIALDKMQSSNLTSQCPAPFFNSVITLQKSPYDVPLCILC